MPTNPKKACSTKHKILQQPYRDRRVRKSQKNPEATFGDTAHAQPPDPSKAYNIEENQGVKRKTFEAKQKTPAGGHLDHNKLRTS